MWTYARKKWKTKKWTVEDSKFPNKIYTISTPISTPGTQKWKFLPLSDRFYSFFTFLEWESIAPPLFKLRIPPSPSMMPTSRRRWSCHLLCHLRINQNPRSTAQNWRKRTRSGSMMRPLHLRLRRLSRAPPVIVIITIFQWEGFELPVSAETRGFLFGELPAMLKRLLSLLGCLLRLFWPRFGFDFTYFDRSIDFYGFGW